MHKVPRKDKHGRHVAKKLHKHREIGVDGTKKHALAGLKRRGFAGGGDVGPVGGYPASKNMGRPQRRSAPSKSAPSKKGGSTVNVIVMGKGDHPGAGGPGGGMPPPMVHPALAGPPPGPVGGLPPMPPPPPASPAGGLPPGGPPIRASGGRVPRQAGGQVIAMPRYRRADGGGMHRDGYAGGAGVPPTQGSPSAAASPSAPSAAPVFGPPSAAVPPSAQNYAPSTAPPIAPNVNMPPPINPSMRTANPIGLIAPGMNPGLTRLGTGTAPNVGRPAYDPGPFYMPQNNVTYPGPGPMNTGGRVQRAKGGRVSDSAEGDYKGKGRPRVEGDEAWRNVRKTRLAENDESWRRVDGKKEKDEAWETARAGRDKRAGKASGGRIAKTGKPITTQVTAPSKDGPQRTGPVEGIKNAPNKVKSFNPSGKLSYKGGVATGASFLKMRHGAKTGVQAEARKVSAPHDAKDFPGFEIYSKDSKK